MRGAPFWTQYLAEPYNMPPPGVTVAAGGRIVQGAWALGVSRAASGRGNTLLAMNAFNGTIFGRGPLEEGFNLHRNTMIATPTTLYVADSVPAS